MAAAKVTTWRGIARGLRPEGLFSAVERLAGERIDCRECRSRRRESDEGAGKPVKGSACASHNCLEMRHVLMAGP